MSGRWVSRGALALLVLNVFAFAYIGRHAAISTMPDRCYTPVVTGSNALSNLLGIQTHRPPCDVLLKQVGFDPSRPTYALTGYMRSGNSWTRHLLQRATGVLTGSIYNDAALQQTGLWGEGVINDTIVVKTHLSNSTLFMFSDLQLFRRGRMPVVPTKYFPSKGAIHLVRNPFDSIASWFQYLQTGTHFMSLRPDQWARVASQWERHVTNEVRAWRWHTAYWMGVSAADPSFHYLRVRYEDLTQDTDLWLRKMLDNLQFTADEYRIQCALESTSCKAMPFNCRQGSVGGESLRHYSSMQRQYLLQELAPIMQILGYDTNVSLSSHLTWVTTEETPSGFLKYCRRDSRFDRSVDRMHTKVANMPALVTLPTSRVFPSLLYRPPLILRWNFANWCGWGHQETYVNAWARMEVAKHSMPCEWTSDKNLVDQASVVLFSGVPHMDAEESWCERSFKWPLAKQPFQRWGTMDYEVEQQFPILGHERWNHMFDFNVSWRRNATVHITMNCPFPIDRTELDPPPKKTPGNVVAYIASRCQAEERDAYVEDLMRYIYVHSFGRCLHNTEMDEDEDKWPRQWSAKMKTIGSFKFVLAFENNNITDWVTEKMPQAIVAGAVPIYMGADNIDDYVPGHHAIIKVTDFASPQKLAEYLIFLDQHDDEYMKYFEWKSKPLKEGWVRDRADCAYYQDYLMCDMAKKWQEASRAEWEAAHGTAANQGQVTLNGDELNGLIGKLNDAGADEENEKEQHMPGQDDLHKGHNAIPADEEDEEEEEKKKKQVQATKKTTATAAPATVTYVPPVSVPKSTKAEKVEDEEDRVEKTQDDVVLTTIPPSKKTAPPPVKPVPKLTTTTTTGAKQP